MEEQGKRYSSNLLAGGVSIVISVAVSIFYSVFIEAIWNQKWIIYLIVLVFLSWLVSMIGYDKVMQAIEQVRIGKEDKI